MKQDLTEIIFILDRSGSMSHLEEQAVSAFNQLLREQKQIEGNALLTLHLFDDEHDFPIYRKPIREVLELTNKDYEPRGCTALFDAIGLSSNKIGSALDQMPESEKPAKVIVAIFTDGEENSSTEYNEESLKKLINQQTNEYSWTYLFLSSDLSSYEQAQQIGIDERFIASVEESEEGLRSSMSAVSQHVRYCRSAESFKDTEMITLQESVDLNQKN